ncbi:P-loop containing nucleoside triphosphate hydrolase protein [Russula earlei]|uniref:P-loop containing nucleoside triphosphate hydrolase protein n=1 Tax=Russula earlei TaxID=71964 RepID=A0ACC0UAM2_9AGAM|nr:P-loop containing nucleoside triphosphate hydrolase protein [Russula earlei]
MSSHVDGLLSTLAPVGLSDPLYASRRKKMFDFLSRVRSLGADVDLDIPAIAVIGWQSAGKSSLIEAISGITLPRASGTCTRCPTECQLTNSEGQWTCTVSLRFTKASDGSTREVQFGQDITEKADVTERIRRAQRAILSPSASADAFLSGTESDFGKPEVSFSSDCIVLHIHGPDVTDLNFVDLPGLFVGGQEDEINLIRDLAISYIRRPSCIILLTVACETDFVNQGAHRLAKEYDPHGERTIGVLTKPDRIPATEEENWLPYIRGEQDDTTSWFCVKCPNTQEIKSGITWEDARKAESKFFSKKAPWSTLSEESKERLGTGNLTRHLSEKLYDLLAERLPIIQKQLDKLLEKTDQELHVLPSPPSSEPLKDVIRLITNFTREMEKQVEGIPENGGLLQQIRPQQEAFRTAIRTTAPCFIPKYKEPSMETEEVEARSEASKSSDWELYERFMFLEGEEDYKEIGLNDGNEIFIDDVLERAKCAVTRELPNNYPFIIQRRYIYDSVKQWDGPVKELFDFAVEMLKETTFRVVDDLFEPYAHSSFKQRISTIVMKHLCQCAKEAANLIKFLLNVEKQPSTINVHYFKDYRRKFFAFYMGISNSNSNSNFIETLQARRYQSSEFNRALETIIFNLSKVGFDNVNPLELAVLRPSGDEDDAIRIMADARAYFQVAYKRFVDNVPKAIDEQLVRGIIHNLQDALTTGLGLDSHDAREKCAKWLAEPARVAEKREKLSARQTRLLAAKDELLNVF